MKRVLLYCTALIAFAQPVRAKDWKVTSPDGKLRVEVSSTPKSTVYSVKSLQEVILKPSRLELVLQDGSILGRNLQTASRSSFRDKRKTPVYRKASINEAYNMLSLSDSRVKVEFRVYNSGVAYRFVPQTGDSITVKNELAEFRFDGNPKVTYLPFGNMATDFQGFYREGLLDTINAQSSLAAQLLVHLNAGRKVFLTDYNVKDYPVMFLQASAGGFKASFPGYPASEEVYGKHLTRLKVKTTHDYIARTAAKGHPMPWRVLLVSENDAQLLDNDVLCSLTPEPQQDFSWVRPGKASWEWWNAYGLENVPFKPGVNNDTYKSYIDFASQNHIEYILMDEGWTKRQQPLDLLQTIPEINMPELVEYARERNVGIVLWSDFYPFSQQMEQVVSAYAQMGIKGFKIDHINRADQKVVRFCEEAARVCAKHHMLIDFHGVFPPTGLQLTSPNVLNYEAVMGLEVVKFREGYDLVKHECLVPFLRQVVGPIDYTQGAMRNAQKEQFHKNAAQPMSQGTRCRQLAEYVVFESPFNMLCDSPTNYGKNQKNTDFIGRIPVIWDETRVLKAKLGEYIVIARRKGSSWYIGGITDWQARDFTLDLSFIQGKNLQIYQDGADAEKDAQSIDVQQRPFSSSLTVHMASGGGFAAEIGL